MLTVRENMLGKAKKRQEEENENTQTLGICHENLPGSA